METYYVYVVKASGTERAYIGASVNFLRELERWISNDASYFPDQAPEEIVKCFTLPDSTVKEAQRFKQFLVNAQDYGILEPVLELFAEDNDKEYINILDFIRTLRPKNPAYTYAEKHKKQYIVLNGKRRLLSANGKLLM